MSLDEQLIAASHAVTVCFVISDGTKGCWDWETGLSYECRTILFKALHNLIERLVTMKPAPILFVIKQ